MDSSTPEEALEQVKQRVDRDSFDELTQRAGRNLTRLRRDSYVGLDFDLDDDDMEDEV